MTTDPTSTSQSSSSSQSDDSKVTSRLAMSDEQRKIRDNFEEKQREEARKKAKLEKAEQKKVRKEIEYEFETMRKGYVSIRVTNYQLFKVIYYMLEINQFEYGQIKGNENEKYQ